MKLDCEKNFEKRSPPNNKKNFEQRNPTKKTFLYAVPTTTASSDNSTSSDSSKSQNCHIQYIYTPTVPNTSRTRKNTEQPGSLSLTTVPLAGILRSLLKMPLQRKQQ
jgi:hypothetical protein